MVPVSGAGEGTTLDPASGLWEGNAFGAGEGLIPHFGTGEGHFPAFGAGEGHSPHFGVGEGTFPASASFAGEGITAPTVSGKDCSVSSDAALSLYDFPDFQ